MSIVEAVEIERARHAKKFFETNGTLLKLDCINAVKLEGCTVKISKNSGAYQDLYYTSREDAKATYEELVKRITTWWF